MIELPSFLTPLLDALKKKGASPVLVGGFVRDVLLGQIPKDIDIEVYNIADFETMTQVLKPFGALNFVGKSFGILKLSCCEHEIDFSLPRLEKKIASGHKGFEVQLDPKLSFKEAAARRDFTINAMGYDVNNTTFLDPYSGYEDLKNKRLTYVNKNTFVEDPLRVLRAVQFCARFELTCSDELITLSRFLCEKGAIKELPKERICVEISKLLLKSKKPSSGLALFKTLHLTKEFPEILDKNNSFSFIDTMVNLKTHNNKKDMILMLSLLTFHFDSIEDVSSFLNKLTNEIEIIKEIQTLYIYRYSLADMMQKPLTNYEILLLSTKIKIQNLLLIYEAQGFDIDRIKERATKLGVLTCKPKALLQGRDLIARGLTPSREFSEILDLAYDAQLQEIFQNTQEAKTWLENYLKSIC